MIAIVGSRYRNCAHYTLYRSCLLIYGIAMVGLLSFLFLDDFEGNANFSVANKSCSTIASLHNNCESNEEEAIDELNEEEAIDGCYLRSEEHHV